MKWYAARTHAQSEDKAAMHLRRQGFAVYLPKYRKLRRHARRSDWVLRPLFPRYLFVGVSPGNERWRTIQSTVGISRLVSFGEAPTPVPTDVMEEMLARTDSDGLLSLAPPNKGQPIEFVAGGLCEQKGLFECFDDNERAVILLDILGRRVRVRAPVDAVQVCA